MSFRLILALAAAATSAAAQQSILEFEDTELHAQYGYSVDIVGDIDGDGRDDLVIGTPANSSTDGGEIAVVSSATGQNIWRTQGTPGARSGEAVANLGDINGDGYDDVAEGAPYGALGGIAKGWVRVFSGKELEAFYLVGGNDMPDFARIGSSVCPLGDVDDDDVPDFAVGAPGMPVGGMLAVGEVWVVSGKEGDVIRKHAGSQTAGVYGEAVGGARGKDGDVDGDGVGDVVIGAPGHDLVGANAGRVEVRSGRTGALLFQILETQGNAQLGAAVDIAGDVNADGFADVIVGAPGHDEGTGEVKLFLGPFGEAAWTLAGTSGVDAYGLSVAGVDDVDRDGYDDVAIGARNRFEVRSGRTGEILYTDVKGDGKTKNLGFALAGGGDIDGDGWLDVVTGAPSADLGLVRAYDVLFRQLDLGFGGPGVAYLEVAGAPLDSFGQADARLTLAPPNAQTAMVASAVNASVPFKGGILVPNPAGAVITWVTTNAQGRATVTGIPGGNGPAYAYLQALVADLSQVANYTISNAVRVEFLP